MGGGGGLNAFYSHQIFALDSAVVKTPKSFSHFLLIFYCRVPQVGMSEEGRVLICWHPEPTHPYEHTMVRAVKQGFS